MAWLIPPKTIAGAVHRLSSTGRWRLRFRRLALEGIEMGRTARYAAVADTLLGAANGESGTMNCKILRWFVMWDVSSCLERWVSW